MPHAAPTVDLGFALNGLVERHLAFVGGIDVRVESRQLAQLNLCHVIDGGGRQDCIGNDLVVVVCEAEMCFK